jgi:acetylornithine deacetylase/succinyl-diaminopimelate desuccinylase-like protein
MKDLKGYIEKHGERFLAELFELIRIPSISSEKEHEVDVARAAEYLKKMLLEAGADLASVYPTDGHPIVYGEKIIDPKKPTVLVYGHCDVMPVDPLHLWKSDPFVPEIREGKIWARGADDDKGQLFMHVKAFEYMVKTSSLPCNVKFLIEGEEEVGSTHLAEFCRDHREMLKADVIVASDTTMIASDIPSITTGLRGLSYWQVELTGPDRDLHSGLFGGAVANPVNILAKLIARCFTRENHIAIPGFYDRVVELSNEERARLNLRPFDKEAYKKSIGVEKLYGEMGFTTIERVGARPSLDVCGIWGGYTGEGAKTILPSKAYAKISARLVADQDHREIADLFEWFLKSLAPKSVTIKVDYLHGGQPYLCPIDHRAYLAAENALLKTFGRKPIPIRSGGSIPIISSLEEILGIKTILMGFGLESDAIHSPNENFPLANFFKGIETLPWFYHYYAG